MKPLVTILLTNPGVAADSTAKIIAHTQRLNPGPQGAFIAGRPILKTIRYLNIFGENIKTNLDITFFNHLAACIVRSLNEPILYDRDARPCLIYDPKITQLWHLWQDALDEYIDNYTYPDELDNLTAEYQIIRVGTTEQLKLL